MLLNQINCITSAGLIYLFTAIAFIIGRSTRKRVPLSEAKSILVIRLDGIGDIAMTSSMLRELRHNCPDAEISLVVPAVFKNMVEMCPYVDHVWGFDHRVTFRQRQVALFFRAWKWCRNTLHGRGFDWVLIPRSGSAVNAETYISFLCKSGQQAIYSSLLSIAQRMPMPGLHIFFSHVFPNAKKQHDVESNLNMLETLGLAVQNKALELWTTQEDQHSIEGFMPSDTPCIALGCNVSAEKRSWPIARYAETVRGLKQHNPEWMFVVVGAPQDQAMANELIRLTGSYVFSLAGKLSLRETCSVLERCMLYVGNDSGPMHLAVAMGTPVVEISCHPLGGNPQHFNAPERFGPYGVPNAVCRPHEPLAPCETECSKNEAHCILLVSVKDVVNAVSSLMDVGRCQNTKSVD